MHSASLPWLAAVLLLASCAEGGAPIPDAGGLPWPDGGVDGGADGGFVPDGGSVPDGGGSPDAGTVELRLERLLPVRGPAAGGTRVTLRGRGFVEGFARYGEEADPVTTVRFCEAEALEVVVVDDDTVTAVAPAQATVGPCDVSLENPNGLGVCERCFTFFEPLTVEAAAPAESPQAGGARVTLTGTGFLPETRVLVGQRPAADVRVEDAGRLTFVTPPAAGAGWADLTLYNGNGGLTAERLLRYLPEPRVTDLAPRAGPYQGGVEVTLFGHDLQDAEGARFGSAPAPVIAATATTLRVALPPGTAGEVVDVAVAGPGGERVLPAAFAYVDPAVRTVGLHAVLPGHGPVDGGTLAVVTGTGLDAAAAQVRFGAANAAVRPLDAHQLEVTVPAAPGAGPVDVQVRNALGGVLLAGGFTYEAPLEVHAVQPSSGPVAGGTAVTVTGRGFGPGLDLRFGALPLEDLQVLDDATAVGRTPAGAAGPNDVAATREGREAVLAEGYTYEEALTLTWVDPSRGARAGGALVSLWGTGLGPDAAVFVGTQAAEIVDSPGPRRLVVRVPPGEEGLADVTVERAGETAVLPQAFQYYDPGLPRGGAGGGAMAGTVNVTVLDADTGLPIPHAWVRLGLEPEPLLAGYADARGQITFSDPRLVKPQSVTALKDLHRAVTVLNLDARDVTLLLWSWIPPPSGSGPPRPPPAQVGGELPPVSGSPGGDTPLARVCGFKEPAEGFPAGATPMARVHVAYRNLFVFEPFSSANPPFLTVERDCGSFELTSYPGPLTLAAVYGAESAAGWQPTLMGLRRGIEVPAISPPICSATQSCPSSFVCAKNDFEAGEQAFCFCMGDSACGSGQYCNLYGACQDPVESDIVLNMHLDQGVRFELVDPPAASGGLQHAVHAFLDVGGEGYVALGVVRSQDPAALRLERLPRLPAESFLFVDQATDAAGNRSLLMTRGAGGLGDGVTLGPYVSIPRVVEPLDGGRSADGRTGWRFEAGRAPDLVQVYVNGGSWEPLWHVIGRGEETGIVPPPELLRMLRTHGPGVQVQVVGARVPRFEFDHFSWTNLGMTRWTGFAQSAAQFELQ